MPKRTLFQDTWYHIYNRGFEKQQIFFDPHDFERFYNNIARYKEWFPHVLIPVWCLIPNHFHFLLAEKNSEPGLKPGLEIPANISQFMNKVQQSYAMYFNAKYGEKVKAGKKGPIFEGRFKAIEVYDEEYFQNLISYIENNAVHHQIVEYAHEWAWRSDTSSPGLSPGLDSKTWNTDDFDPYFE